MSCLDTLQPVNDHLTNSLAFALLRSKLPKSTNEAPLFALSLLRLLSQNRIAEFHTLLETLPKDTAESTEVAWVLKVCDITLLAAEFSLLILAVLYRWNAL